MMKAGEDRMTTPAARNQPQQYHMKTKLIIALFAGAGIALASPQAPTAAAGYIPDWLDTDGDGVISELERQAFVEARKSAAESLAAQWDTNGDGVIDEEERAAAIAELKERALEKLTELFLAAAGEDEVLTLDEFAAVAPDGIPAETIAVLFGLMDANGDGEVTLDEFLAIAGSGVTAPAPPTVPPVPPAP